MDLDVDALAAKLGQKLFEWSLADKMSEQKRLFLIDEHGHFTVKANPHVALLRELLPEGLCLPSLAEMQRIVQAVDKYTLNKLYGDTPKGTAYAQWVNCNAKIGKTLMSKTNKADKRKVTTQEKKNGGAG